MDDIYKRLNDDTEVITNFIGDSEIQKFYAGKTVFLTGSTGFMGKCLMEKMLRSCPDLKRIYVLVRPKRGCSIEKRMNKYFDDLLFDRVREMYPDYESKVQAIEGDLAFDDMRISEKDRNTLIEEVDYIFHNASNVKFTEPMSVALKINVLGTIAMINLAKKCKKLETFMYVSTAYSHNYNKDIEEVPYPSPADANMVRDLITADTVNKDGLSDEALKDIVGVYKNTYCFTKATAEGLIDQMGKEVSFRCIIYRPAIVISSWKEPVTGWCGNLNGPAFIFIAYAIGIVRTAYVRDVSIDIIPVDMSINAIIVSMWDATNNRTPISGSFVYNYGSSTSNPITLRRFNKLCLPIRGQFPSPSIHTLWPLEFSPMTECMYKFAIFHILLHFIPAVCIDAYLLLTGKKTIALSTYKKATNSYFSTMYFINGGWRIHMTEMNKAIDRMNSIDRELFFCDVRELDWADYCRTYWHGLRVFLLKDPISTVPAAEKKFRKLQIMNNVLKYTFLLLIVYMIVSCLGIL